MAKDYVEHQVVNVLNKKHDIRIIGNMIQELLPPASKGDVGIRRRGKITFLKKYCNYRFEYVKEFRRN